MRLTFNINFGTKVGEKMQLVLLENGEPAKYYDLIYTENSNWTAEIDYFTKSITYKYQLTDLGGNILDEEYAFHCLNFSHNYSEFEIFDVWNLKNFPENYLNNKILANQLGKFKSSRVSVLRRHTHLFRLEAPVYHTDWQVIITGNCDALGNWNGDHALEMKQVAQGVWEAAAEVHEDFVIDYKYGLKNEKTGEILSIEYGESRKLQPNAESKNSLQIQADHFFRFRSEELYHAAGVAVPVFSLRSENGFGVGEFADIKSLADWAKSCNLSIIQTLPINDSTANYSWTDSYPYAPVSLYALHPIYLSIDALDFPLSEADQEIYQKEKSELNDLELIDYERVISAKWKFIRNIFNENLNKILRDREFKKFIKNNENWLLPYSAFCILRDKYGTPNFNEWKTHRKFIPGKIAPFFAAKSKDYNEAMLHSWVQFQLHKQLSDAVDYAHAEGVSLKGDLPIGIYRYSVEAWTEPELYGMDFQAGAPPDQFTDLGQNWGFPTYNWDAMKADGYRWWKSRFQALEQYFDAMRIDHILGFFRIWRIPMSATQGILGYFYPAVPVTAAEFSARYIPFNYERYCKPFINDEILYNYFGDETESVKNRFLDNHQNGLFSFKEEYNSQRKLTDFFAENQDDALLQKLLSLSANVLFLEENRDGETVFHPRFNNFKTDSYRFLSDWEKQAIYELYNDYFFKRQDGLWYQSAMEKLPPILNSSEMLICGEDLGLVPDCVPQVMDRLGIVALKVQRMPAGNIPFSDPKTASYLNVVTASSHDSSTLRQWWHENRELTQQYFNAQLQQWGTAPWNLEPYFAAMIMKQHLYSEAMLAIFPIQEFFATDEALANPNIDNERINNPAVFPHYWRYRMHISLEDLKTKTDFNQNIAHWVQDSGRK